MKLSAVLFSALVATAVAGPAANPATTTKPYTCPTQFVKKCNKKEAAHGCPCYGQFDGFSSVDGTCTTNAKHKPTCFNRGD